MARRSLAPIIFLGIVLLAISAGALFTVSTRATHVPLPTMAIDTDIAGNVYAANPSFPADTNNQDNRIVSGTVEPCSLLTLPPLGATSFRIFDVLLKDSPNTIVTDIRLILRDAGGAVIDPNFAEIVSFNATPFSDNTQDTDLDADPPPASGGTGADPAQPVGFLNLPLDPTTVNTLLPGSQGGLHRAVAFFTGPSPIPANTVNAFATAHYTGSRDFHVSADHPHDGTETENGATAPYQSSSANGVTIFRVVIRVKNLATAANNNPFFVRLDLVGSAFEFPGAAVVLGRDRNADGDFNDFVNDISEEENNPLPEANLADGGLHVGGSLADPCPPLPGTPTLTPAPTSTPTPTLTSTPTPTAAPKIIRVPADEPTIQSGIDSASDGDTVLVSPGTYFEAIDFRGKDIRVTSEQGADATVIDGGSAGSYVRFHSGEQLDAQLRGFTLQNTLVDLLGASPTIIDNVFDANGHFGGGIAGNVSSATIERNMFVDISCSDPRSFGVVAFINESSPRIVNNVFADNFCSAINMTLPVPSAPKVLNNTIVGNSVGIRVDARVDTSRQAYVNNIMVQNEVGLLVEFGTGASNPTWKHNLVYDNVTNYSGISDQTGINGNISADPLFIDVMNGNCNLQPDSPAIDAGDNAAPDLPTTDFDGDARILDGNGDEIAVVDIGVDEFSPTGQPPVAMICPRAPGPTATPTNTPTPTATPTPTPTATPTPPPAPHDAAIRRVRGPRLVRLSPGVPGSGIGTQVNVVASNLSAHSDRVGVYVAFLPPTGIDNFGRCSPAEVVNLGELNLLPGDSITLTASPGWQCTDPSAVDGLSWTLKAVADAHADDFSSCSTLTQMFDGTCAAALASDDTEPANNTKLRPLPKVIAQ